MRYESQKYNKGMNDTGTINQTNIILTPRRKDGKCFQADRIRNTRRSHCKGHGSNMAGPDLATNNKILASLLDPILKELEALHWTSTHQNFLGQRSGTTMEKVHRWECRYFKSKPKRTKGGKTYAFLSNEISWAKTFMPKAWVKGSGAKNL